MKLRSSLLFKTFLKSKNVFNANEICEFKPAFYKSKLFYETKWYTDIREVFQNHRALW